MNWTTLRLQARAFAAAFRFVGPGGPVLGKAGFHGSSMAGSSLEYKDFRAYQPGDDLRHLDWRAYGRTDRLIVKRYHDEVTPHLDLLLDVSKSMDLPGSRKAEAAAWLTVFFAQIARQSSYTATTWLVGDVCRPLGAEDPMAWEAPVFEDCGSAGKPLRNHGAVLRRQGMRILITDTLWPEAPRGVLSGLAVGASTLLVVALFSSRDLAPEGGGYLRLQDSETGRQHQVLLDEGKLARYHRALNAHRAAWDEATRTLGVIYTELEAETFLPDPEFDQRVMGQVLTVI